MTIHVQYVCSFWEYWWSFYTFEKPPYDYSYEIKFQSGLSLGSSEIKE
jgi:hypothetical protein